MKKLFFSLLALLRAPDVWKRLNRRKILIVVYHGFTDGTDFKGIENYNAKHLNVDRFRQHVAYLSSHYNLVSLGDIVAHYSEGKPLPPNPAAITVDDGYRSTYLLAYPVLREFQAPATVFVTTDFLDRGEPLWTDRVEYALNTTRQPGIDLEVDGAPLPLDLATDGDRLASVRQVNRRFKAAAQEELAGLVYQLESKTGARLADLNGDMPAMYAPLKWSEVAEMVESGLVSIGSHTSAHLILSRCGPETTSRELSLSKEAIEQRLGQPCGWFCYPNGTVIDFDQRTREQLVECGYVCGITAVPGLNDYSSDVMELKRLGAPDDMAEFMVTVSGFRAFLARGRRLLTGHLGAQGQMLDGYGGE